VDTYQDANGERLAGLLPALDLGRLGLDLLALRRRREPQPLHLSLVAAEDGGQLAAPAHVPDPALEVGRLDILVILVPHAAEDLECLPAEPKLSHQPRDGEPGCRRREGERAWRK
jgi:hypothetical protein